MAGFVGQAITLPINTWTRVDNRGGNTTTQSGHVWRCDDGDVWINGEPAGTTSGVGEAFKVRAGEPFPATLNGVAQVYANPGGTARKLYAAHVS